VNLPAPLGELPLLARAGTLLPLLPPDVDTLARYGDRSASISLGERERRRVLLAFPRGSSSAALEDGGTLRSIERRGEWSLTVRSSRARTWEIQASLGTLRNRLRPCRVSAHGGRLQGWRFDRRTRVLTATLSARDATLTARACRG
jgi:hypothetical protein